jgi:omega-amidase
MNSVIARSTIMDNLTVTLIQPYLAWEDKKHNLEKFEKMFQLLKHKQDLIILPEMFSTGFVVEPRSIAEPPDGKTIQWLREQSSMLECVITGSLVVVENGNFFNRLVWMNPDGTFLTYDKRHLFRLGDEHLQFSQGNTKLIVTLNGWKICPLVCYDLRFPVWSKNNYRDGIYDYDLLIYIANWPGRRSYAFRHLLIARAIENQSYVIGVNRVGMDGKGILHQGDSAVIDFKGKHLIEVPSGVEDMETITLDYENLREFRESFTVGLDWDEFEIIGN